MISDDVSQQIETSIRSRESLSERNAFEESDSEESNSEEIDSDESDSEDDVSMYSDTDKKKGDWGMISKIRVVRMLVTNSNLLTNADREQRSDQDLAREAALLAKALGVPITKVRGTSYSAIRKRRLKIREQVAQACSARTNNIT